MSNTPSPPASPLWRQNPLASRSLERQSDRRRWLIFLLLASVLAFAGILVGLLSWLRPIPRPVFLPIWVSNYQSRQLHFLPWAEQDFLALTRGGYFSRWLAPPSESQGQRNIRQGLGLLAGLLPTDSLVVYVNARACVGPGRELALLPADADPAAPRTWITLREILEALKSSPAARKLLVLDLSKSSVEPRGAMLGEDVAARIPDALRAVPDPARLTLTASSPGQTSLVSDELGRSVFSYYFEEALRGWTELDRPQRHRDGLVLVRDLARYVRTRVNRWARGNKGARQEPVLLGQGEDFPLLALKQGKIQPEPPLPPPRSYPAWLRQGWEMRDRWKADSSVQAAPLAFRQLQLTLLLADAQWRGGLDPDRILQDQMANLGLYQQWLESVQAVRQPRPASLAQAAAQGWTQDPTVVSALNAELNPPPAGENAEATKSNAGAGSNANANSNATTKTEPAAPQDQGQTEKSAGPAGSTAKTKSKGVPAPPVPAPPTAESFQQKTQGASTLDLAGAFFDAARKLDPTAENLIKLDNLLKVQQPEPLYSETLFLRQLAERARASKPEDWPTEVVQRALRVASLAEQANGSSETLAWLRLPLEEAGQIRHNARVILLAQGFASPREADRLYRVAEAQYALILDQQQAILEARKLWLNALECLPFLLDNAFSLPFRAGQDPWSVAASQTLDLQNALRLPPEVKRGKKLLSSAEIRQRVAALRALTETLRLAIDDLCRPFQTPAVNALLKQARMPRVGSEVDLAIERALWTPMPSASERADLWKADSDLTRRRLKANLQQDRSGQAPPDPSTVESQGSHEAHYRILAARARRRILLLRLAGLSDAKARPLHDQVDQMLEQPGSSGDADHSRSWWNLELALHTTWEGGQERPDAPSKGLQDGEPLNPLVAPPWSLSFISAAPKGEIYEFWLQERQNWLAWLANQYEYEGADLTGTPFFRTAARELRALSGGDNRARIASPWEPTRSIPAVSLSNEAPVANDSLAIQIPSTPQSSPIPIQVLLHDTTWLRVGPASTQLRRQVEQGETEERSEGRAYSLFPSGQSLQQVVPLRIELNRAAEEMDGSPPQGFLVRARVAGRDFHQAVGVSLKQASERLQILLSANPSQPTYPQVDLGLRAIKERQPFYLYLRNPTGTSWDVQVGLAVGDQPVPGTPPRLTLAPGEISKVRFASTTIKADAPLPDLNAPLKVEVRNAADLQTVLGQATIDTRVAEPTEYIHVSHVEYAPSSAGNPSGNQLSVSLGASPDLAGPPVVAQLVLPPDQIPGFLGVGDGTSRASLPQGGADATLFVKNLRRRPEEHQGGTFYVQVDSYPRGIAFRASFPPDGQPTLPLEDARPALRLRAASTSPAIPNFPVRVEVDHPLPGSSLEIGLGRVRAGVFEPEIIRKFSSPQDRRIGFSPGGPDGSLLFEASAKDWSVPLDLSGTEGARILRARLLDENGQEIRSAMQPLMIDDQAPAGPTFLEVPAQARKGSKLTVRATAGATQSGIKAARFFVGSPPASAAPLPATQATTLGGPDSGGEIWSAELTLPATPGPATLSAQFESGAGQFAYASTSIELTETDPITPGQIQGRVLEGPRPQPGLVVRLTQPPKDPPSPDAQAKSAPAQNAQEPTEIAKTTTEADGTFRFENVAPGSYTLNTRKEASLTKAKADVTVKPNVISQATLELFR